MSHPGTNIIRKQLIDFSISGDVDAFVLQQEFEKYCKEVLVPQIEATLEKYSSTSENIQIGVLNVDVSDLPVNNWQASLVIQVIAELEKSLSEKIDHVRDDSSVVSSPLRALIFYLENSFLPWWSTIKNSREWEQELTALIKDLSGSDRDQLLAKLKEPELQERFLIWFSDEIFWLFVDTSGFSIDFRTDLQNFESIFNAHHDFKAFSLEYKRTLLVALVDKEPNISEFSKRLYSELEKYPLSLHLKDLLKIKNQDLKDMLLELLGSSITSAANLTAPGLLKKKSSINQRMGDSETKESIYINNSGLVIVAPYLQMFFQNSGVIREGELYPLSRAVALLQYIAAGAEEYAEFELVLPKILCGTNIRELVPRYSITEQDKLEVNELLQSLIEHWSILKNTSPQGLRECFFQREGKLHFENNTWYLTVQHKSFDMLLDHLPWNISLIKLPWMNYLIRVEWT